MSRSPKISAILKIPRTRLTLRHLSKHITNGSSGFSKLSKFSGISRSYETHTPTLLNDKLKNYRDSRTISWSRVYLQIKHDADRGITMIKQRLWILTFLERGSLVFLQPLHRDRFQPDPGRRIFLENVPHILLAEDEQVRVAHRSHAGCSSVTCVNVAIYWLSGCVKLFFASARERSILRSFLSS